MTGGIILTTKKGFTLIEIMVSLFLATLLLSFVYILMKRSFFEFRSGNEYIGEVETIQDIGIRLRRDLYAIKPSPFPIDLLHGRSGGQKLTREYHQSVLVNHTGSSKIINLDPMIVETENVIHPITGRSTQELKVTSSSFYTRNEVEGTQEMLTLQNAFVVFLNREIREDKFFGVVDEYYINTHDHQIRWRYYKIQYYEENKEKFGVPRFVRREVYDKISGSLISDETFSSSIVTRFFIQPFYWTRCIYYQNGDEWHGFSGSRIRVSLSTTAPMRDTFKVYEEKPSIKMFYLSDQDFREKWPGKTHLNFMVRDPYLARHYKAKGLDAESNPY